MKTKTERMDEIKVDDVEMPDADGWTKIEPGQVPAFKFEKPGDTFVGTYEKFRSNVGPNGSMLYSVKDTDGKSYVIWGSGVLDGRMESIRSGTQIKIVYKGIKKSEKTHREYHDYDVYNK